MKIKFLIAILVVILVVLGSGWVLTSNSLGETRIKLEIQQEKVITLEEVNQELYLRLEKLQEDFKSLEKEFTTKKTEWENLENALRENIRAAQDNIRAIEQEVISLQESLDLYKNTFGEVYSGIQSLPYGTYETQFSLEMRNFKLVNNEDGTNPTWKELKDFLREDPTDQHDYLEKGEEYKVKGGYLIEVYMCGNFAEALHNNAEEAGIRAAWVALHFEKGEPHALNAFVTTDKGLVFIDSTGLEPGVRGPRILDKIWTVELNKNPIVKSVFSESGWETRWKVSTGKITKIRIYW